MHTRRNFLRTAVAALMAQWIKIPELSLVEETIGIDWRPGKDYALVAFAAIKDGTIYVHEVTELSLQELTERLHKTGQLGEDWYVAYEEISSE